jgi:multimeric flavodoxin WrbA
MNILLVNGSPRRGNTFRVLENLGTMVRSLGHETNIVHLNDYKIKQCSGCYNCILQGIESCPIKDDIPSLWNLFSQADGIVLSSPVYALGVTGVMKNFMDRVAYNAHRPKMYNKPTIIVSTTAGMGVEKVISQLKWFEICGLKIIGSIGFLVYPKAREKEGSIQHQQKSLMQAAQKLDKALKPTKMKSPTLIQLIQFYGVKMNCDFGKDIYKADYEYYKNKIFHVEVPMNKFKLLIAKLFYKIGYSFLESKIEM